LKRAASFNLVEGVLLGRIWQKWPTTNGMKENSACTPHVHGRCLRPVLQQLWCHSFEGAGKTHWGVLALRSPTEICDLEYTVRGDEKIVQLDVSVNHPCCVYIPQGQAKMTKITRQRGFWNPCWRCGELVTKRTVKAQLEQQKHTASFFGGSIQVDYTAPPWLDHGRSPPHCFHFSRQLGANPTDLKLMALHDLHSERLLTLPITHLEDGAKCSRADDGHVRNQL
jgi:hypothetical protein